MKHLGVESVFHFSQENNKLLNIEANKRGDQTYFGHSTFGKRDSFGDCYQLIQTAS